MASAIPAFIETTGGRWVTEARQVNAELTHRLTIRWSNDISDIRSEDRIVYVNRIFDVAWVEFVEEGRRWVRLYCVEREGHKT
jgi:SPP1 family predicted phage head-tail adaptor